MSMRLLCAGLALTVLLPGAAFARGSAEPVTAAVAGPTVSGPTASTSSGGRARPPSPSWGAPLRSTGRPSARGFGPHSEVRAQRPRAEARTARGSLVALDATRTKRASPNACAIGYSFM